MHSTGENAARADGTDGLGDRLDVVVGSGVIGAELAVDGDDRFEVALDGLALFRGGNCQEVGLAQVLPPDRRPVDERDVVLDPLFGLCWFKVALGGDASVCKWTDLNGAKVRRLGKFLSGGIFSGGG